MIGSDVRGFKFRVKWLNGFQNVSGHNPTASRSKFVELKFGSSEAGA